MQAMLFKDYFTGETVAKKKMPRAEGRSITYGFEYVGGTQYFFVRDWHTNEVLHKFARTAKLQRSLEFYPVNVDDEY